MTQTISGKDVLSLIDHTILKPDASLTEIKTICAEAKAHQFYSVCVNSCHVPYCKELLEGTGVKVCSVIGFPLGAMSTAAKAFEAATAIDEGACEIDMVINVGLLKSGQTQAVKKDIKTVLDVCKAAVLKVIIETGLLSREEKILACQICKDLQVGFVKTSTGFGHGGATVEDVKLMRQIVGPDMGVKASGGVRSLGAAFEIIKAGANRIGTSSGVAIAEEGFTALGKDVS